MEKLATDIWIFDGEAVTFFFLPFTTRMTVIKLANGDLWVHSPIHLSDALKSQIDQLGLVKYLIAPNHLHHLFLPQWIAAYPDAKTYGTSEVIKKRNDISFDASLNVTTWTGSGRQIFPKSYLQAHPLWKSVCFSITTLKH